MIDNGSIVCIQNAEVHRCSNLKKLHDFCYESTNPFLSFAKKIIQILLQPTEKTAALKTNTKNKNKYSLWLLLGPRLIDLFLAPNDGALGRSLASSVGYVGRPRDMNRDHGEVRLDGTGDLWKAYLLGLSSSDFKQVHKCTEWGIVKSNVMTEKSTGKELTAGTGNRFRQRWFEKKCFAKTPKSIGVGKTMLEVEVGEGDFRMQYGSSLETVHNA